MSNYSKILTLICLLVVIFWSKGLAGKETSLIKYYNQRKNTAYKGQHNTSKLISSANNDSVDVALCDLVPPHFTNLFPQPEQTWVDRNSPIQFTVIDGLYRWESAGVDTDSIFISITSRLWEVKKEKPIIIDYLQDGFQVNCIYELSQPYDWTDTIEVMLIARDCSHRHNHGDTTYTFYVIPDTMKPKLTAIYPQPEQSGIDVDTMIMIQCEEKGRGIDLENIVLKINGTLVDVPSPDDRWNFTIDYQPRVNWSYNDRIHVYCSVRDLDGNMDTLSYGFTTEEQDIIPPDIEIIHPQPGDTNVSIYSDIVLRVNDSVPGSMVDFSTAKLLVNNSLAPHEVIGDTIIYLPLLPFAFDQHIYVQFEIADSVGNSADTTYWFKTEPDMIPPEIITFRPMPEDTKIPLNTDIVLRVIDPSPGTGVDFSTTKLVVNNSVVPHKVIGDTIKHIPPLPFDFNQVVDVTLEIADFTGNWADTSYWFKTERDTIAPEITIIRPQPFDTVYLSDIEIVLTANDSLPGTGVDFSTVKLQIDNTLVSHTVDDDTTRYLLAGPLSYNQQVDIYFEVADSARNWADTSYWFIPRLDTIPPEITMIHPLPGDTNVSENTDIMLQVIDPFPGSGIDFSRVKLFVDSLDVSYEVIGDTIQYLPTLSFSYGQKVVVDLWVADFAGNEADTSYWFEILKPDTTPPEITIIYPQPGDTKVPVNTDIVLYVKDEDSGIDDTQIELIVDGNQVPCKIMRNCCGDTIIYHPITPFNNFQNVPVEFYVADLWGNEADTSYSFSTIGLPDLHFSEVTSSPDDNQIKVMTVVTVCATITNDFVDCDNSFDIKFYFDDRKEQPFYEKTCENLDVGQELRIKASILMKKEGNYRITVYIDPDPEPTGKILEANEFNNEAKIEIKVEGAELIIRSNPFTPNDDGFNDFAEFNFEQFQLEQPKLKLFDIQGKCVKKFDFPQNDRFTWYGRDDNDRPLTPGMYFYVLLDRSNPIKRGCVLLIK